MAQWNTVLGVTPPVGDNSRQVATTAFVQAAVQSGGSGSAGPQPANVVFAGPASGANAAPTFRALIAGDIPTTLNPVVIPSPFSLGITNGTGLILACNNTGNDTSLKLTAGGHTWSFLQYLNDLYIRTDATNCVQFISATGVMSLLVGGTVPNLAQTDNSANIANTAFVHAAVTAGPSDVRLKDIVSPYEGGLDAVLALNPVYYRWNEEGVKHTGFSGDKTCLGFTAQDVGQAIPECVPGTEGAGYLLLDQRPITAALVDAVKTLAARIDTLETKWAERKSD